MRLAPRLFYLLTLMTVVIAQVAQAQVRPTTKVFIPACNQRDLNRAYIAALNNLRHKLDPHASLVQFDSGLYVGAVLHAATLTKADSLFHSLPPALRSAELCGYVGNSVGHNPVKIAKHLLEQFENSERHCLLQSSTTHIYIAIAAGERYAVVKLAEEPTPSTKAERAAYVKLGIE